MTFQSTLPTRGSDMPLQDKAKNDIVFQSTLPTRGSDGRRAMEKILRSEISIHAPHEGERPQAGDMRPRRKNISIHAPHEGERLAARYASDNLYRFQSTLPTRGSDTA